MPLGTSITEGTIKRAKERDKFEEELKEAKERIGFLEMQVNSLQGKNNNEPPF